VRDIPAKYEKLYNRAMSGKSRKAAIRAFCLECVGWSEYEVSVCTYPDCPLYPYRPKEKVEPPLNDGVQDIIEVGRGVL
jgi:hypothetical protein